MNRTRRPSIRFWATCAALCCAACGESAAGSGSVRILLESEAVIADGLEPGDGVEDIQDGWSVRFDEYLVSVGEIDLHLASDLDTEAHADDAFAVDLHEVPADGLALWTVDDLASGRWELAFAVVEADADGVERHSSVPADDFERLTNDGLSYLVRGELEKEGGVSCPPVSLATPPAAATSSGENGGGDPCYPNPRVRFELSASDHTRYGPCEIDGVPGFSVADDATQTVALTFHGDHLFFNGFPEGGEGGVMRLAQWLADCDLDLDGTVTDAELDAITPAALYELDERFQLGGSPLQPLDSMHTYVRAQLKTQGHFQGEGECQLDGEGHGH